MIVNASETTTWRVLAPFLVRLQRANARRSVIAQNGDPGRAATILGQQPARFAGRDADGYFWHPAWLALGDTAQALTALDEGARQGLVGVNLRASRLRSRSRQPALRRPRAEAGPGCGAVHVAQWRAAAVGHPQLGRVPEWCPRITTCYLFLMTSPTSAQQQAWMAQWRSAAVELARVGQSELMQVDLWRVAADLEDACVSSARAVALTPASSGLVEQQRWLHRRSRS